MPTLVGDRGVTLAPLHPSGLVLVGGERRDARALVGSIDAGTNIIVVGWGPFGLVVRPAAEVDNPARLPNRGVQCPSHPELVAERDAVEEEVRRESLWARNLGSDVGNRLALVLPLTVVAAGAGWVWAGVPAVAIGALVVILIASLLLAWLVLD
jgi:hypothetical protein